MPNTTETTADTSAQTPEEALINGHFAAFERWRNSGELPTKAESSSDSDAEQAAESETTTPDSDPEKKQDASDDAENDDDAGEKESKRGIKKRFRELTSEIRELRAKLDQQKGDASPKTEAAPKPSQESGKPQAETFTTYDEYIEALTEWKVEQKEKARAAETAKEEAKRTAQRQTETFVSRVAETAKEAGYADIADVINDADVPLTPAIQAAILRSEVGPKIAYHLAKNAAEALRISKLDPVDAVLAIGEIRAKLIAKPEPQAKRVSKAPAPPKPVSGSGSAEWDLTDPELRFSDFEKQANKRFRHF